MKVEIDIRPTVQQLAAAFCELDDDAQARFFVEVARIAEGWDAPGADMQWHRVGQHLRTCKCSTPAARDLVLAVADSIRAPQPMERNDGNK